MTPLSNGVRRRTSPAYVPTTSPPVKPAMPGKVVIHFVKVTSTGRALSGRLGVCVAVTEDDGAVGGRDPGLSHTAPRIQQPRIIRTGLSIALCPRMGRSALITRTSSWAIARQPPRSISSAAPLTVGGSREIDPRKARVVDAVLWWSKRRGDRGRPAGLGRHGDARLAARKGLTAARDDTRLKPPRCSSRAAQPG